MQMKLEFFSLNLPYSRYIGLIFVVMMAASACRKMQREMERFDRVFQIKDLTALNLKR